MSVTLAKGPRRVTLAKAANKRNAISPMWTDVLRNNKPSDLQMFFFVKSI